MKKRATQTLWLWNIGWFYYFYTWFPLHFLEELWNIYALCTLTPSQLLRSGFSSVFHGVWPFWLFFLPTISFHSNEILFAIQTNTVTVFIYIVAQVRHGWEHIFCFCLLCLFCLFLPALKFGAIDSFPLSERCGKFCPLPPQSWAGHQFPYLIYLYLLASQLSFCPKPSPAWTQSFIHPGDSPTNTVYLLLSTLLVIPYTKHLRKDKMPGAAAKEIFFWKEVLQLPPPAVNSPEGKLLSKGRGDSSERETSARGQNWIDSHYLHGEVTYTPHRGI